MMFTERLINLLDAPAPPPAGGFVDLPRPGDGCTPFAALNGQGEIFIVGYRGEWYAPVKPGLRARIRNWLVGRVNRRMVLADG